MQPNTELDHLPLKTFDSKTFQNILAPHKDAICVAFSGIPSAFLVQLFLMSHPAMDVVEHDSVEHFVIHIQLIEESHCLLLLFFGGNQQDIADICVNACWLNKLRAGGRALLRNSSGNQ